MTGDLIHIGDLGAIESGRLERSLSLAGEPVGDGRYLVVGGTEPHWVDLRSPMYPRCDCGDYLWRDTICKHILAARLREGDPGVIRAVALLVNQLRAMNRDN